MSLADEKPAAATRARRALAILPLAIAVALASIFAWALTHKTEGLPPPVKGRFLGLSSTNLKGEVSLVNVFASWCVACRDEHPLFMKLTAGGVVPLHGLNYKDHPDDAAQWLDKLGDPYARTGADLSGRVAIDWGVYGVPETFVVGPDGRIAHKHIGAVTEKALAEKILPLVESLRRGISSDDRGEDER